MLVLGVEGVGVGCWVLGVDGVGVGLVLVLVLVVF